MFSAFYREELNYAWQMVTSLFHRNTWVLLHAVASSSGPSLKLPYRGDWALARKAVDISKWDRKL